MKIVWKTGLTGLRIRVKKTCSPTSWRGLVTSRICAPLSVTSWSSRSRTAQFDSPCLYLLQGRIWAVNINRERFRIIVVVIVSSENSSIIREFVNYPRGRVVVVSEEPVVLEELSAGCSNSRTRWKCARMDRRYWLLNRRNGHINVF